METYAGFASHTDHQVGRLVDALEEIGVLDNTLVFYILGDNGASAEAGPYGTFNEMALQNQIQLTTGRSCRTLTTSARRGPLIITRPAGRTR